MKKSGRRKTIPIFIDGNLIRVSSVTKRVERILTDLLTYKRKNFIATYRKQKAAGRKIEIVETLCYRMSEIRGVPQLITNAGYLTRVTEALTDAGYQCVCKSLRLRTPKQIRALKPKWENLAGVEFRYRQREVLEALVSNERGQINWATGTGKGWLIPYLCQLLPRAKIIITTKSRQVLETNYHRIAGRVPSTGMYHGGLHETGYRVTCVSSGSLHRVVDWNPDIIIADEHHELATDKMLSVLAQFRGARVFGMSANYNDRLDGADFELEGIFGPRLSTMTYQEAVKHGLTVPIEVNWNNVALKRNPCADVKTDIARWRNGIWRNTRRNKLIAEVAGKYDEDEQVLITVRTVEHACFLSKYLPDYTLCYAPGEEYEDRIREYVAAGILDSAPPKMTHERLSRLRGQFENGHLKKVIATTIWNRGVNFEKLQVLIRAESGSSPIDDTQGPGRLARTHADKTCGIVEDFLDEFDRGYELKAVTRCRNYRRKGWRQHFPKTKADL